MLDQLIPITGYAETYEELCNKIAESGAFFNVLNPKPFVTYCKTGETEIGDTMLTTDVCGWYQNKAELDSNVRPGEGEVYITGISAPYTRWKAEYVDYKMEWVEDGTEDKKIIKRYKNAATLGRGEKTPEEGIYYSVGKELPYKVYGVVSTWEPVGSYISYVSDDIKKVNYKPQKSNPGEIAFVNGIYYLYNGKEWEEIDIPEPIDNVYKHVWETKDKKRYKLREGAHFGTLEYFAPRE